MSIFQFKHFSILQKDSAMKIGTDAMILGALVSVEAKTTVLDIGTGTGVLSLMLAQKNKNMHISAIEIDEKASFEAKFNVENSTYKNQIDVIFSDFLEYDFSGKFDLIVTNPPFFENSLKSSGKFKSEQTNLARHTDSLPFERLIKKVSDLLNEEGDFWIILPHVAAAKLIVIAHKQDLFLIEEIAVYGKPNILIRKILRFSKNSIKHVTTSLLIRENNSDYSDEYKSLTFDFHNRKL